MKAGFLEEEKEVPPVSAAALETKFAEAQAEAQRLRSIVDPEETPFDSRYEERSVLMLLSKQAAANEAAAPADSAGARRARTIRSLAEGQLGRNFIDTEEPGSAQARLEAAIEGLEGVEEEAIAHIEALNNLGVVWCNRGEAQTAHELLGRAREAHARIISKSTPLFDEAGKLRLEDANTLSTYYMAQVCAALGQRAEAASHCHDTMRRQLKRRHVSEEADAAARLAALKVGGQGADLQFGSESKSEFSFDAQEWARNAADLSKYYATVQRLDIAEHCLHAAEAVLSASRKAEAAERAKRAAEKAASAASSDAAVSIADPDEPAAATRKTIFLNGTADDKAEAEKISTLSAQQQQQQAAGWGAYGSDVTEDEAEQAALVDLAWARLWLAALKRAAELLIAKADDGSDGEAASGSDEAEAAAEGAALGPLTKLSFEPLKLPTPNDRLVDVGKHASGFEGARELFRLGSARAARAKSVLVLDGFVTMHFEVIEVELELYAQLAMWEADLPRKHAMHKRRLGLLQPAVKQLSEKAYAQLVRQGLFDCATIACEMLEIKAGMVPDGEPAVRKAKKLEQPVTAAVDACKDFLRHFEPDGKPPAGRIELEQERAYLQCKFHLARALGKLESPASLGASLQAYEALGAYLAKHKVEGMDGEMQAAKEMAELLPHKIKRAMAAASS